MFYLSNIFIHHACAIQFVFSVLVIVAVLFVRTYLTKFEGILPLDTSTFLHGSIGKFLIFRTIEFRRMNMNSEIKTCLLACRGLLGRATLYILSHYISVLTANREEWSPHYWGSGYEKLSGLPTRIYYYYCNVGKVCYKIVPWLLYCLISSGLLGSCEHVSKSQAGRE